MNITECSENHRQVFRLNVPSKYLDKLRELGIKRFGIDPGNFNGASVWQSYDYDSDTAGLCVNLMEVEEQWYLCKKMSKLGIYFQAIKHI